MFIINQSKRINVKIPAITFDQPLWLKATEAVNAKALKVILILGGFHLMMSFISSMSFIGMSFISHLMKGSGISEVLGTVYGSNAVEHMISQKAVSRALRGHFLLSSALNTKLLSSLFPGGFRLIDETEEGGQAEKHDDDNNDSEDTPDLNTVMVNKLTAEQVNNLEMLENKLKKDPSSGKEYLETSEEIALLEYCFKEFKEDLASRSRTAKFWLCRCFADVYFCRKIRQLNNALNSHK